MSFRPYIGLIKFRILLLLNYLALVSSTIAEGGLPPLHRLLPLLAAGSLSSAGSMAVNDYLDREADAKVPWLSKRRPLAMAGISPPWKAAFFGLILISTSLLTAFYLLPLPSVIYIAGGVFFYIIVYTMWLKPRHWLHTVVGGLSGSFACLAGWTVVKEPDFLALALATLVFLWQPGHFWSLALSTRGNYARGGIPVLTDLLREDRAAAVIILNALLTVVFSILAFLGRFGGLYLATALLMGGFLMATHLSLLRQPSSAKAWRAFKASSPYLGVLLTAMVVDTLLRSV